MNPFTFPLFLLGWLLLGFFAPLPNPTPGDAGTCQCAPFSEVGGEAVIRKPGQ